MTAQQSEAKPSTQELETTITYRETRSQVLSKLDNISYGKGGDALLGALDAVAEHFGRKRAELGMLLLEAAGHRWGPKEAEALLVTARKVAKARRAETAGIEAEDERAVKDARTELHWATKELADVVDAIDGEGTHG